jgi:hypothetical protein
MFDLLIGISNAQFNMSLCIKSLVKKSNVDFFSRLFKTHPLAPSLSKRGGNLKASNELSPLYSRGGRVV